MPSFSDNFNRANGALGSNWINRTTANIVIVSNQATQSGFPGVGSVAQVTTAAADFSSTPDQFAQFTITGLDASIRGIGVCLRSSAAGGYYCMISTDGTLGAPQHGLFYVGQHNTSSGSPAYGYGGTSIVNGLPITWNIGDVFYFQVVGSALTLKQNGSTIWTGSDTNLTTGQPGLWQFSTNGSLLQDDFSCGGVSANNSGSGNLSSSTQALSAAADERIAITSASLVTRGQALSAALQLPRAKQMLSATLVQYAAGTNEAACLTTQDPPTDSITASWYLPDQFRPDVLNSSVPSDGGFLIHTDTLERLPHLAMVEMTQGPQQTRARALNFGGRVREATKSRTASRMILSMEARSLTMQMPGSNQAVSLFVDSELEIVTAMLALDAADTREFRV